MENARDERRGNAKVIFLAQIESIRADMARGLTSRAILDGNKDLSGMSYSQFNRYVRAFITDKSSDELDKPDEDYVDYNIIVHRKFRKLFRLHASEADLSEYEFLRMIFDKYEAGL